MPCWGYGQKQQIDSEKETLGKASRQDTAPFFPLQCVRAFHSDNALISALGFWMEWSYLLSTLDLKECEESTLREKLFNLNTPPPAQAMLNISLNEKA